MALFLPLTIIYAADLQEAHQGTEAEGGECTWHFVHNQINKGKEEFPSLLMTDFDGVEDPMPKMPTAILKKVRHYDVVTTSAGPVTLLNADDNGFDIDEGKLLLSDVSCEPITEIPLSCLCWKTFSLSSLVQFMNNDGIGPGEFCLNFGNTTVVDDNDANGSEVLNVSVSSENVNFCFLVENGSQIQDSTRLNLTNDELNTCRQEARDVAAQLNIPCPP